MFHSVSYISFCFLYFILFLIFHSVSHISFCFLYFVLSLIFHSDSYISFCLSYFILFLIFRSVYNISFCFLYFVSKDPLPCVPDVRKYGFEDLVEIEKDAVATLEACFVANCAAKKTEL